MLNIPVAIIILTGLWIAIHKSLSIKKPKPYGTNIYNNGNSSFRSKYSGNNNLSRKYRVEKKGSEVALTDKGF